MGDPDVTYPRTAVQGVLSWNMKQQTIGVWRTRTGSTAKAEFRAAAHEEPNRTEYDTANTYGRSSRNSSSTSSSRFLGSSIANSVVTLQVRSRASRQSEFLR